MSRELEIVYKDIDDIIPYENNPRINDEAAKKVARSIKDYGWQQAIAITKDNVVIAGHTRLKAAHILGLKKVPCIVAENLTDEEANEYRLIDNKVAEFSSWDFPKLNLELTNFMDDGILDDQLKTFGFGEITEADVKDAFKQTEKGGVKKQIGLKEIEKNFVTSFFVLGKEGKPLSELKQDKDMVEPLSLILEDYINVYLGKNIADGDWVLVTPPRREHPEGFHLPTAICENVAPRLGIRFVAPFTCHNRDRLFPMFTLDKEIPEHNVILYDDIITTGKTMAECRRLLEEDGHVVVDIAAIHNK